MGRFDERYSADQKEAMAVAYIGGMTGPQVVEQAALGRLKIGGETLPPFDANQAMVRREAQRYRERKAARPRPELADLDHRDAVEMLRLDLLQIAELEIRRAKQRQARSKDPLNAEHLRQVARVVRELASLPGRDDPAPPTPGQRIPGTQTKQSGASRGGLAAQVIAASRRTGDRQVEVDPAPSPPPPPEPEPEPRVGSEAWRRREGERLAAETMARWESSRAPEKEAERQRLAEEQAAIALPPGWRVRRGQRAADEDLSSLE